MKRNAIIIGIDGMRVDALLAARTPSIDALAATGAWSWKAQTEFRTVSGPAWTSVLTGVHQETHNVDGNENMARKRAVPTLLARVKATRPGTRIVARSCWSPIINEIIEPGVLDGAGTGPDTEVARGVAMDIEAGAGDLFFLQVDGVDAAGHQHGYGPGVPGYLDAIEQVDALVGTILEAIATRDGEQWLEVLVSDHGGSGRSHGGLTVAELTVPFIVAGEVVHPRGEIPGEDEDAPHVVDVVPTIAKFLGIEPDPGWEGTARCIP